MTECFWCGAGFTPGKNQRFCRTSCRQGYHSACRKFTAAMLKAGFVSMEDLRRKYGQEAPCTPRTVAVEPIVDARGLFRKGAL